MTDTPRKLKPFRCFHCKTRLVVMDTSNGSVLPIEIPDGELIYDDLEEFDGKKHKSHLLNCKGLQGEWEKKKWKFIKQRSAFAKI